MFDHVFEDFVTLYAIFNPTGILPSYLHFTQGVPAEEMRRLAVKSVLIATAILVAFVVLGQVMLEALGIALPSFSIAGGLVLLVISLRMIFESVEETAEPDEAAAVHHSRDLAVFPLATPLIAGPGGILVVVLLTDNHRFDFSEQAKTTLVLLVVMALTLVALLAAGALQRLLGATGINVTSRILGLILAALAVQTVLDGIRASFSLG